MQNASLQKKNTPKQNKKKRKFPLESMIFILGIMLFLYPLFSYGFNSYRTKEEIRTLSYELTSDAQKAEVESLKEYNSTLLKMSKESKKDKDEEKALSSTLDVYLKNEKPLGILSIPKIGEDIPIYYGSTDEHLRRGVGVMEGTSLPFGGKGTHSLITGHRGTPDRDIFFNLDLLTKGDFLYIKTGEKTLAYRMIGSVVVLPEETEYTELDPDRDLVTLITCTPKIINSHRLLLYFERDLIEEKKVVKKDKNTHSFETGMLPNKDSSNLSLEDTPKEDLSLLASEHALPTKEKTPLLERLLFFLRKQSLYRLSVLPVCIILIFSYFRRGKKKKGESQL